VKSTIYLTLKNGQRQSLDNFMPWQQQIFWSSVKIARFGGGVFWFVYAVGLAAYWVLPDTWSSALAFFSWGIGGLVAVMIFINLLNSITFAVNKISWTKSREVWLRQVLITTVFCLAVIASGYFLVWLFANTHWLVPLSLMMLVTFVGMALAPRLMAWSVSRKN
jgi:small-conductance mechanosensitive channel